jgi:hypothetical protein
MEGKLSHVAPLELLGLDSEGEIVDRGGYPEVSKTYWDWTDKREGKPEVLRTSWTGLMSTLRGR